MDQLAGGQRQGKGPQVLSSISSTTRRFLSSSASSHTTTTYSQVDCGISEDQMSAAMSTLAKTYPAHARAPRLSPKMNADDALLLTRTALRTALRHMGIDTFRSSKDRGIEIGSGTGNAQRDDLVFALLSPFIRPGGSLTGTSVGQDRTRTETTFVFTGEDIRALAQAQRARLSSGHGMGVG